MSSQYREHYESSPELRLTDAMKRTNFIRFFQSDDRYTLTVDKETVEVYATRVIGAISEEGGRVTPTEGDLYSIEFPEGTIVQEYDVPSDCNSQGFRSIDAYVYLPSGTKIFYHMHGYSNFLRFAKD